MISAQPDTENVTQHSGLAQLKREKSQISQRCFRLYLLRGICSGSTAVSKRGRLWRQGTDVRKRQSRCARSLVLSQAEGVECRIVLCVWRLLSATKLRFDVQRSTRHGEPDAALDGQCRGANFDVRIPVSGLSLLILEVTSELLAFVPSESRDGVNWDFV